MDDLRGAIYALVAAGRPMTCRQVFYRLVAEGRIAKTESEYKSTVVRLLSEMRLEGQLPFSWIADNTRWMRKPTSYDGVDEILGDTARTYRRALWRRQDAYVELWLEKEALAGVLYPVTEQWDVPLMVTRGYASLSFLYAAANTIESEDRPAHIYFFGDWDPSGLDIARSVEERLEEFAPAADIYFERVAVTPEQISAWSLPTRPTKRTDTRSRRFVGGSVEVDAIAPDSLRELARSVIEQHVDWEALARTRYIEEQERELLRKLVAVGREMVDDDEELSDEQGDV